MAEHVLDLSRFQRQTEHVYWSPTLEGAMNLGLDTQGSGVSMPLFWDWHVDPTGAPYQFLTMDVTLRHTITTTLVLELKRPSELAEDRVAVSFSLLPNVPTRLCLPLARLDAEQLFLERYPGVLKMVVRGAGLPLKEVSELRISGSASEPPPTFQVSRLCLSTEEPNFPVKAQPMVDELGQLLGRVWDTKTLTQEALTVDLHREADLCDAMKSSAPPSQSASFFRTSYVGERWWLIDPQGRPFISVGFNCVSPGESMRVAGMEHLAGKLPSRQGEFSAAWSPDGKSFNFGVANLIRAFGPEWLRQWQRITERRLQEWGVTTIACWSDAQFIQQSGMPYVLNLHDFPDTPTRIFRDFPDVFSESYEREAANYAQQLLPIKDDVKLIGYFLRNEPHWAFVENVNLAAKMLASSEPLASKQELARHLQEKYGHAISSLNAEWRSNLTSYKELMSGVDVSPWAEIAHRDLREFTRRLVARYVEVPARAARAVDSNHLNLGMRYAWISSDDLWAGHGAFDVFSLNMYRMQPDRETLDRVYAATGLPIILGEFHHGGLDVGLLAGGLRSVASQGDRGRAYRAYVEPGLAHPAVVGVHYFQWNDQPLLGRYDGENYQIGAVDVCHKPYEPFIAGVRETHQRMYDVASHKIEPYTETINEWHGI